jgi:hypothetical protein
MQASVTIQGIDVIRNYNHLWCYNNEKLNIVIQIRGVIRKCNHLWRLKQYASQCYNTEHRCDSKLQPLMVLQQ